MTLSAPPPTTLGTVSPGTSAYTTTLDRRYREYEKHVHSPVSRQTTEQLFADLAETWANDTKLTSSSHAAATHWAYQTIIGMGPRAVPLILNSMKRSPNDWFWALAAITRANPIPADAQGDVRRMTDIWIQWGKSNGFLHQ